MSRTAGFLVLVAMLVGCAPHVPPVTAPPDPTALYAAATRACRGIRTLTAVVRAGGRVGSHGMSARLLLASERPDRLRLEGLAPFGKPGLLLAARGGRVTLVLPRDDRYLEGATPRGVLDALFGLDLTIPELIAVVSGCAVEEGARPTTAIWTDRRRARADVALAGGRSAGLTLFLPTGGAAQIESATLPATPGSDEPLLVRYRNISGASGVPSEIRLDSRRAQLRVTLALEQIETNTNLEPRTFEVAIPPDAAPLTLEELKQAGPLRVR